MGRVLLDPSCLRKGFFHVGVEAQVSVSLNALLVRRLFFYVTDLSSRVGGQGCGSCLLHKAGRFAFLRVNGYASLSEPVRQNVELPLYHYARGNRAVVIHAISAEEKERLDEDIVGRSLVHSTFRTGPRRISARCRQRWVEPVRPVIYICAVSYHYHYLFSGCRIKILCVVGECPMNT